MAGANGVDLSGPLAGMWRDVYRKAGAVAEARTQELLKYHVYTYPHGAGGGGGGGGAWSLVEKITVATPTARVTFASVPAAGDCLLLISRGSVTAPSGNGAYFGLNFNGDPYPGTTDKYRYVMSDLSGEPATATQHLTTGSDRFAYIGYMGASLSGATANDGGGVSICYLPDFTAPERLNAIADFQIYHTTLNAYGGAHIVGGRYSTVYDDHGPLTALAVQCGNALQFDAGSTFALYVLSPGGGGGNGGPYVDEAGDTMTGTLEITKSAGNHLVLNGPTGDVKMIRFNAAGVQRWAVYADSDDVGAYGNLQFARYDDAGGYAGTPMTLVRATGGVDLAGPLTVASKSVAASPDSGNTLEWRTNGFYTAGGGAGGTGNTTMYTQTSPPTGATNSLWFNPSESA